MKHDIAVNKGVNKEICEDTADFIDNIFWIIDGASVPKSLNLKMYNANWLVTEYSKFLHNFFAENPSSALKQGLKEGIAFIKNALPLEIQQTDILPSATIAILRVNSATIDYVIIGDCSISFEDTEKSSTIADLRLQTFGQNIRDSIIGLIKEGYSYKSSEYIELTRKLVIEERAHMNKFKGYWVISTAEEAVDNAIEGSFNYNKPIDIIMYTDGFGRLLTHYKVFRDEKLLIRSVKENGLKFHIDMLRKIEKNDKHGSKYPRTSFSDDATCIFLKIS